MINESDTAVTDQETFSGANLTQYVTQTLTEHDEVLHQTEQHPSLSPYRAVRESRGDNPSSLSIFFDVTGSMGDVPERLTTDVRGLARLFDALPSALPNPQLLFGATGDSSGRLCANQRLSLLSSPTLRTAYNVLHADLSPIQCGQFASNNRCVDDLTNIWREAGGGGNGGESYHLAWLFALRQYILDSWGYGKKGILITIGDEIPHPEIRKDEITSQLDGDYDGPSLRNEEILERLKERFVVFHICIDTAMAEHQRALEKWQSLLGADYVISLPTDTPEDIASQISDAILTTILPRARANWTMPPIPQDLLHHDTEDDMPWRPIPRRLRLLESSLRARVSHLLEGTDISIEDPDLLTGAEALLKHLDDNRNLTSREFKQSAHDSEEISPRVKPIIDKIDFRNLSQAETRISAIIDALRAYQTLYLSQPNPAHAKLIDEALEQPIQQLHAAHGTSSSEDLRAILGEDYENDTDWNDPNVFTQQY